MKESPEIMLMSLYLDPRLKVFRFIPSETLRLQLHDQVLSRIHVLLQDKLEDETVESGTIDPSSTKVKLASVFGPTLLQEHITSNSVEVEITRYDKEPTISLYPSPRQGVLINKFSFFSVPAIISYI